MNRDQIYEFIINWELYNRESFIEFIDEHIDRKAYLKFLEERGISKQYCGLVEEAFIHDIIDVKEVIDRNYRFNRDNYDSNLKIFAEFIERVPLLIEYIQTL